MSTPRLNTMKTGNKVVGTIRRTPRSRGRFGNGGRVTERNETGETPGERNSDDVCIQVRTRASSFLRRDRVFFGRTGCSERIPRLKREEKR